MTIVHLAAPGVDILSTTRKQRYASYSGTSQSAPMVAGVVALLLSREPNLTPLQVRERLMATIKRLPNLDNTMQASGIVDAFAALRTGVTTLGEE